MVVVEDSQLEGGHVVDSRLVQEVTICANRDTNIYMWREMRLVPEVLRLGVASRQPIQDFLFKHLVLIQDIKTPDVSLCFLIYPIRFAATILLLYEFPLEDGFVESPESSIWDQKFAIATIPPEKQRPEDTGLIGASINNQQSVHSNESCFQNFNVWIGFI